MMSSAEAMRAGLPWSCLPGLHGAGHTQVGNREAGQPGLGLGAAAGRALVADLAAGAGGGAGEGRDGGRVVVRLDLHQDVDRLVVARRRRRVSGSGKNRPAAEPSMTAALSLIGGQARPSGLASVLLADHLEQRLVAGARRRRSKSALKILWRQCSELACANIISSTSVGLRPRARKAVHQVVDLVVGQRQAQRGVRPLKGGAPMPQDIHRGKRLRLRAAKKSTGVFARVRARSRSCGHGWPRAVRLRRDLAGHRVLDAALDAPDLVEAAVVGDVGGLGRPWRNGSEARNHQQRSAI